MAYSTDTRTLRPGDVYVAIRGDLHDGHAFVPQAIARGASGIVVETGAAVDAPEGVEVIRVESPLGYLTASASEKVQRLAPNVVAITGSVGKTSTRAAVAAVLREAFPVVASEGNLNTPLGLSLLLLNRDVARETTLVLEMGARLPGDIRDLCALFPPTVAVVTNVRGVHVETFGSVDGVEREKGEIVRALGAGGTACLNGDDPRARRMAALHAGRTLTFGTGADCDVRPDRLPATLPILGEHAVPTALAAVAVGLAVGMDEAAIHRGLAAVEPEKGRLRRLPGRDGMTLLDDTYNASPDATLAALRVLARHEGARRIAFLGDMLELGDAEAGEHVRVLTEAAATADAVHAVGPRLASAADALPEAARSRVTLHEMSSVLADALRAGEVYTPRDGDVVLVKGSQGLRMERVSEALLHPDVAPADVLARQSESWKAI